MIEQVPWAKVPGQGGGWEDAAATGPSPRRPLDPFGSEGAKARVPAGEVGAGVVAGVAMAFAGFSADGLGVRHLKTCEREAGT